MGGVGHRERSVGGGHERPMDDVGALLQVWFDEIWLPDGVVGDRAISLCRAN
jgi:hypothetical protein